MKETQPLKSGTTIYRKRMKPGYAPNQPAPAATPVWSCTHMGEQVLCRTKAPEPPQTLQHKGQAYRLIDVEQDAHTAHYELAGPGDPAAGSTDPSQVLSPPDTEEPVSETLKGLAIEGSADVA